MRSRSQLKRHLRNYFGEIAIIVIGILLALAADEAVQNLRMQGDVRTFREAVGRELALNLGTYRYSQHYSDCIESRINELDKLLKRARHGHAVALLHPISKPPKLSQYSAVWENKDPAVVGHLPMSERLKYGELYDEFRNTAQLDTAEDEVWRSLTRYNEPGPLNLDDRRRLGELISRARMLRASTRANYPVSLQLGVNLGIRAEDNADWPTVDEHHPVCQPLMADSEAVLHTL